ncbi:MarR family winged helix-turn-helix transcriptional regulator [Longirhabdus pacifica]|uniref:MarR family winged helix-turn-helix transcriptional regulator n=1 Tax=Longirhabdus pacifica TaxID=2305227 RepID=UPI001008F405|nr:MarR family transcriptional regulator [Longirhabdus pacifica]
MPEHQHTAAHIEQFTRAIQLISDSIRATLHTEIKKSEVKLTMQQFTILNDLASLGPITISQLAERMQVNPATISPMIDRLEKQHWVSRGRLSKDKRIVYVILTDSGKQVFTTIDEKWKKNLEKHLQSIPLHTIEALTHDVIQCTKLINMEQDIESES